VYERKERLVELAPEPVDEEVLERVLGTRERGGPSVRGPDACDLPDPELLEGLAIQADRVAVEVLVVEDPRLPLADEHHALAILQVGCDAFERVRLPAVGEALEARAPARAEQIEPPVEHAVGLREEAVPAQVDAVSAVDAGAREPPDLGASIEHGRHEIGPLQQLERSREARRARSDDDGPPSRHRPRVFRGRVVSRTEGELRLDNFLKSEQG
jgi:hypothetical protein